MIQLKTAQGSLTEEALRESEESYRTVLDLIDEGFCIIEVLFDEAQRPLDYRFLQVNVAFEQQTGFADAVGQTMRTLAPNLEEHWFEMYGKVALSGQPVRFDPDKVSKDLATSEATIDLSCGSGPAETTLWTCDLSKEYVTINADYHT